MGKWPNPSMEYEKEPPCCALEQDRGFLSVDLLRGGRLKLGLGCSLEIGFDWLVGEKMARTR